MFTDFIRAPNIANHPDLYRLENEALARDGRLDRALQDLAPTPGHSVVDIGCGTGFWLDRTPAASIVGVEPDPQLRALYTGPQNMLEGSAEHLPLPDGSIDVAIARFAYFFGTGSEAGLVEVARVLRPSGVFLAVDNSWSGGDFAELLEDATTGNATIDPVATDRWWAERGAERHEVSGGWATNSPEELEAILRIEFPSDVVDRYLSRHPPSPTLSYAFAVYRWPAAHRPAAP